MVEKTLRRETAFQGTLLRLDVLDVELPDGEHSRREVVYHPDAVCAVVFTREDELVLVRQFRKPVEAVLLEIPAGKIDPGETPEQTVLRELREEIGFLEGRVQKLTEFYATPGFCTERMSLFLVEEAVLGEPDFDHGEFIEVVRAPLQAALGMIERGELGDAKSIAGILMAARHLGR